MSDLFNGASNVDNVYFNSNIEFKDGKLWIRNPADTNSVKIRAGTITNTVEYQFPPYNSNAQILLDGAPQEITNKTIDFSKNTIIGGTGGSSASNRKTGLIQAPRNASGGTASEGILGGHIDVNPATTNTNRPFNDIVAPPGGSCWVYDSTTTTNTNAGIRYANPFIRRDFDARIKCKVRIPLSTGNHQFLFGFTSDTEITPDEPPIRTQDSGFLIGYRNTDANFKIFHNGGTSALSTTTSEVNLTNVPKTQGYRTYEIAFRNSGAEAVVTVQNISTTAPYTTTTIYTNTITSNLPAITVPGSGQSIFLRPWLMLTNRTATSHIMEVFYMELESLY